MVKVQKPTPKTFSKLGKMDENPKKQKSDKVQKQKKVKDVAPPPTPGKKAQKDKLIGKTVQEAKIVEPVKNVMNQKSAKPGGKQNPKQKVEQIESQQSNPQQPAPQKAERKKQLPKVEQAIAKPPLVLAPPESPAPAGKNKNKKQSNAVESTETAAPIQKSKKQKNKNNKTNTKDATCSAQKTKPEKDSPSKMQQKNSAKKAFKRLQLKKKAAAKTQPKKPVKQIFDTLPFDEEKFLEIVNVDNIKNVAKALKTLVEEEVAKKKSIFSDYQYFLNVVSFKIPSCPKRMVKLNVKHSLVDKDDDILIIVPDLQRGSKFDYEPTIQHYEDLFREAGVEGLKIMPFNQLRTEYNTFETVRKLSKTYDYYLCDGRLVGQVAGMCGKTMQKPRTTFHAVRMENTKNLKSAIEKSLRRTAYKQLEKGDLIAIPVGNHKFTMQQLAENVEHVVSQLKTLYPGGWGNVRSMYLKIDVVGTSSLPIYLSVGQAPPAEAPFIVGPREQRMLKLRKEANEVLSRFNLTKEAEIIKLNKKQVDTKRKLKETRAALLAEDVAEEDQQEVEHDDDAEPAVPVKKVRKEEKKSKVEAKATLKDVNGKKGDKNAKKAVAVAEDDEDDDDDDEEAEENEVTEDEKEEENEDDESDDSENEEDSDEDE